MFNAWKTLDQQTLVIKNLWVIVGLLLALNLLLGIFLALTPNRLRIYLPPDLSQGALIKPGVPDKSTVYGFAFQILTSINSWPDSGTEDYGKNIEAYRHYLSAGFYHELKEDLSSRVNNSELSRTRIMAGVADEGYAPESVEFLGNGSWLVKLHLQIEETLDGSVIKNVVLEYPVLVSQVSESITINPWGLVVSGFKESPHRIKTLV